MDPSFLDLLGAGFLGALLTKAIDFGLQEITRRNTEARTAKRFVDKHLTPLLKSADELSGKLRSLVEKDFKPILDVDDDSVVENLDYASLVFLIGDFWGQIEKIRRDAVTVDLAKDERGVLLQTFLNCLESRRVRILDRISQRAIGEVFLNAGTRFNFIEFVKAYRSDREVKSWLEALHTQLSRMRHTKQRQRLLQYGIVVHAMIDTLDPTHAVTNERPSWPNKLSKKSWRELNYRIFGVYLIKVRDRQKYIGPPKGS